MGVFITNATQSLTLKDRIQELLRHTKELKIIVGFFYFSGLKEFYEAIKDNPDIKIKILVGLNVDKHLNKIIEYGEDLSKENQNNIRKHFINSLRKAINSEEVDIQEFYDQFSFFLSLLKNDKLIIRKTKEPNHAKLYIFKLKDNTLIKDGFFITGSSNLTRAGLSGQHEFNVEIKDYGLKDAEEFFDDLWNKAVRITEVEETKKHIIDIFENQSIVANVSPYQLYAFFIKTYLDTWKGYEKYEDRIKNLLEEAGFQQLTYQIDAVKQALKIINTYNGVIIADVVGLGKSVIASLIANLLNSRGLILCPPSLIGDKDNLSGWYEYLHKFKLYNWDIESTGKITQLAEKLAEHDLGYEVVIIDEAHKFRNENTPTYEALSTICRNKKVILLSATPFNNKPSDIFALLKLFIVPGNSPITLNDDLDLIFYNYQETFRKYLFILKNINNSKKRNKVNRYLKEMKIDANKSNVKTIVKNELKTLSQQIKNTLAPVIIRRNRLDLKNDPIYKKEIRDLPEVKDPKEIFFTLSKKQSKFYDEVINRFDSGKNRKFSGAIYRPYKYNKYLKYKKVDQFEEQQQENLFDLMRRILVKRFESSFSAFEKSIERFIQVHEMVLKFIETSGVYFLDRSIIEAAYTQDEDNIITFTEKAIQEAIQKFEKKRKNKKNYKYHKIYELQELSDNFKKDIEEDIKLFKEIRKKIEELNLVSNDPKIKAVIQEVEKILNNEPQRKIIIFSEYQDTVTYLEKKFTEKFQSGVLVCKANLTKSLYETINKNFNAQYKTQENNYNILITTDKLSEGINLNRAGVVINYDIPWNPTRVIQRVGRINRIARRVFDELFIYNIFPTERGEKETNMKKIAENKMLLIHSILGEDAKIFSPEEEPSASELYQKLNKYPEEQETESLITTLRQKYQNIKEKHPEIIEKIEKLPNNVKSAKTFNENNVIHITKKNTAIFSLKYENNKITELTTEDAIKYIECNIDTPKEKPSKSFWENYKKLKQYKPKLLKNTTENAAEIKALNNLKSLLGQENNQELKKFIQALIEDINNYKSLPKATIKKLAVKDTKTLTENIKEIKTVLGKNYIEQIKKMNIQNKEIIITLENIKK